MSQSMLPVSGIGRVLEDVFADFLLRVADKTERPVLLFGPVDNQAKMAPPGVLWSIGDETWEPGSQHGGMPGKAGILWVRNVPIEMVIFGGENTYVTPTTTPPASNLKVADVTEALIEHMINSFQMRLTQNGYRVTQVEWSDGAQTGIGVSCRLVVTVRLPLVRQDNPTKTIEHVNPTVEIATP